MDYYNKMAKDRKHRYKDNKTIITLCNYILKLTSDEKALKRAAKELKKAKEYIKHEDEVDELISLITNINCKRIATDECLSQEEKDINIKGLTEAHREYSIK